MNTQIKTIQSVLLSTLAAACLFGCDAENGTDASSDPYNSGKADEAGEKAYDDAYACVDALEEAMLEKGEEPDAWLEKDAEEVAECDGVLLDVDAGESKQEIDEDEAGDKNFGESFWRVSVKCENVCISLGRSAYQSSTRVGEDVTYAAAKAEAELEARSAVQFQAAMVCSNEGWTIYCSEAGATYVEI